MPILNRNLKCIVSIWMYIKYGIIPDGIDHSKRMLPTHTYAAYAATTVIFDNLAKQIKVSSLTHNKCNVILEMIRIPHNLKPHL